MPETISKPMRKHGLKAKLATRRSCERKQQDLPSLLIGGKRIRTSLTMARSRQAYLWFTDRGRSRVLIKF